MCGYTIAAAGTVQIINSSFVEDERIRKRDHLGSVGLILSKSHHCSTGCNDGGKYSFHFLLSCNSGPQGIQTYIDIFITAVDLIDVADYAGTLR